MPALSTCDWYLGVIDTGILRDAPSAEPLTPWHFGERRCETQHMEAFITSVTEQQGNRNIVPLADLAHLWQRLAIRLGSFCLLCRFLCGCQGAENRHGGGDAPFPSHFLQCLRAQFLGCLGPLRSGSPRSDDKVAVVSEHLRVFFLQLRPVEPH